MWGNKIHHQNVREKIHQTNLPCEHLHRKFVPCRLLAGLCTLLSPRAFAPCLSCEHLRPAFCLRAFAPCRLCGPLRLASLAGLCALPSLRAPAPCILLAGLCALRSLLAVILLLLQAFAPCRPCGPLRPAFCLRAFAPCRLCWLLRCCSCRPLRLAVLAGTLSALLPLLWTVLLFWGAGDGEVMPGAVFFWRNTVKIRQTNSPQKHPMTKICEYIKLRHQNLGEKNSPN